MAKEIELQQTMLMQNGTIEAYTRKIRTLETKINQIDDEKEIAMLEAQIRITKEQFNLYFKEQKLLRGIETNDGKKVDFKWLKEDDLLVGVAE